MDNFFRGLWAKRLKKDIGVIMDEDELWSIRKVARHLQVSKKWVYRMLADQKLEGVKLGPRSLRVLRSSVEGLVERGLEKNQSENLEDHRPLGSR